MESLVGFLGTLTYWHWFALGAGLMIVEIFLPTFYMMWVGIGAIVVGLIVMLSPALHWSWQLTIFGLMSVTSSLVWNAFYRRGSGGAANALALNQRMVRNVGRRAIVAESFRAGRGSVLLDDTRWQASCEGGAELVPGASVEIVGADGSTLRVRAA